MTQADPYLNELKGYIRNTEKRFISYKNMLEGVHRDKSIFPPQEPWVINYKNSLRDLKNQEESHLKRLIEEMTYYPGMTPSEFNETVAKLSRRSRIHNMMASIESSFDLMTQQQKEAAEKLLALING